jgi:hypothetical protein
LLEEEMMVRRMAVKATLAAAGLALLIGFSPGAAAAHVVVGVGVGPFWGGPFYGPYPYYYPPPVVYAPPPVVYAPPPVVVAPPAPAYVQQPATANAWYYCDNPQGYYPTVQNCSTGWRQVAPQPSH